MGLNDFARVSLPPGTPRRVLDGWRPVRARLAAELDGAAASLPPGGALVLETCVWERIDGPAADWYEGQRRALEATRGERLPALEELRGDPPSYEELRAELDRRFAEVASAWVPVLHRFLGAVTGPTLEQALIDAGAIRAAGFRYAGVRR